jgi:hypothetical protein
MIKVSDLMILHRQDSSKSLPKYHKNMAMRTSVYLLTDNSFITGLYRRYLGWAADGALLNRKGDKTPASVANPPAVAAHSSSRKTAISQ